MTDEEYNRIKNILETEHIIHVHNYEDYQNAVAVFVNEKMRKHNKLLKNDWCPVSWEFTYSDLANDELCDKCHPKITRFVRDNWHKLVTIGNRPDVVYRLIGLEMTNEDLYYILNDEKTGKTTYETCVSKCMPYTEK